jgi:hypothetical protein
LFLLICAALCACKDKGAQTNPPVPPNSDSPGADTASGLTNATAPATATPEQIGSVVQVRVTMGGLPSKTYTGAILHRDEIKHAAAHFEQNRCVVALLQDWTEEQLRLPDCKFSISRNLPNEVGDFETRAYHARLLGFDSQTKIATLGYHQQISADAEVGFRLMRDSGAADSGTALRFAFGTTRVVSRPAGRQAMVLQPGALILESTSFSAARGADGDLKFPESESGTISDEAPLIVGAPAVLKGFALASSDGKARLVPAIPGRIPVELPKAQASSLTFSGSRESTIVRFQFEAVGQHPMPEQVTVKIEKLAPGRKVDLAALAEPFSAIAATTQAQATYLNGKPQKGAFTLEAPDAEGSENAFLVQLAWKLFPEEKEPSIFARPFLIRLARQSGGIVPTTEGVSNLNEAKPKPDAAISTLPQESMVTGLFPIAGGREVLVQLQAQPHWKRYSLEKKEWLPLPNVSLSDCDLAGNLSHLFVLNRANSQLSRYRLTDLTLAGSVRLQLAGEQWNVRAGCISDRAPVHVLTTKDHASFDPETLQRKDYAPQVSGSLGVQSLRRSTGDGMTLVVDVERASERPLVYAGDLLGLRQAPLDSPREDTPAVSGYFSVNEGLRSRANEAGRWSELPAPERLMKGRGSAYLFALPNVPFYVRAFPAQPEIIPPAPPLVQCVGFSDRQPLAEFDAPELAAVFPLNRPHHLPRHPFCFDPLSRRVLTLAGDQKSLVVRDLTFAAGHALPVLLNWPDTSLVRGGEFEFRPEFFGEGKVTAELVGPKEPTELKVEDKVISFRVAPGELATLLFLTIKLEGPGESVIHTVPLHVAGAPQVYAMPAESPVDAADQFGNTPTSLRTGKGDRRGLVSSIYLSPSPVQEALGPVQGHLALITHAKNLDLLSLETKRVVHSMPVAENATYFSGCGALYEYDADKRSLTRITVPDGRRGARLTMPAETEFCAIGLGSQPADPLTVIWEKKLPPRKPGAPYAGWNSYLVPQILNSETLAAAGWAPPQIWASGAAAKPVPGANPKPDPMSEALRIFRTFVSKTPRQLAGSRSGAMLVLPQHLMVISPQYAILAPYPAARDGFPNGPYGAPRAFGSITGIVASNTEGMVVRNGVEQSLVRQGGGQPSPCGRYQLLPPSDAGGGPPFEIRALEGSRPILRIHRHAVSDCDLESPRTGVVERPRLLQDSGPLMLISRGGKLLQFVELDVPRIAQELQPAGFHVVSQPVPCVMEGTPYEYQIQVNNPAAVASYKLRAKRDDVTVSPTGKVSMRPPATVLTPMQMAVSLEIAGTNGQSVLHEFALLVLPRKVPPPSPPAGPSGTRPLGSGTIPRLPGTR